MDWVDPVEHEKSEEQRKLEEEDEFGGRTTARKQDPRHLGGQERNEQEMTHLPPRIWRIASREGERSQKYILDYMFMGDEKEGKKLAFFVGQRKIDEGCAQLGGTEVVDGRVDVSKVHGMAS